MHTYSYEIGHETGGAVTLELEGKELRVIRDAGTGVFALGRISSIRLIRQRGSVAEVRLLLKDGSRLSIHRYTHGSSGIVPELHDQYESFREFVVSLLARMDEGGGIEYEVGGLPFHFYGLLLIGAGFLVPTGIVRVPWIGVALLVLFVYLAVRFVAANRLKVVGAQEFEDLLEE